MLNPFVFNKRVKAVIISYKASEELKKLLKDLNIETIKTLPNTFLDVPVNDHPDLVVHPIDYKNILVCREYFNYYHKKLSKYDINVFSSKNYLEKNYPKDIYLNVSRVGRYFFHKKDCIDENLNEQLIKHYKPVNVKQGYAKCSTMIIKNETVVTTDLKLHEKYLNLGLKSYLLPPDFINLPGYDTGFIGGTCGNIGKDEIIFYGNLEKYRYSDKLLKILKKENIKYYYPKTDSFIDRGSVIGILGG
ncbi:DUF6873 family GME fold protein [Miniphocaeibacter massiliensis]|uniref:DUF6873 family GME fold protein n=1 Tax=Miniphocaeibacter massiliensis TaxID=2041841 RepID=UPI000C07B1C6|nr:hypothetical protein [Miniphocaeibacter massiliensis]